MTMFLRGLLLAVCLATPALAQKDRIVLQDGTVFDDVRITAYDIDKIVWTKGGREESRKSDQVADVTFGAARDEFAAGFSRGGGTDAYQPFLDAAKGVRDQLLKQHGYRLAAQTAFDAGQYAEAFQILEELKSEYSVTAHAPLLFQLKLQYYLGRGPAGVGDARTTAKAYENESVIAWSKGFQLDAKVFGVLADLAGGDADARRVQTQLDQIIRDGSGYPNPVHRAKLIKANLLRNAGDTEAAEAIYQELVDLDYKAPAVRGEAWLGLGHVLLLKGQAGDPTSKEALLAFLRVYLDREGVPSGLVAEALYFGAKAAEKWGGEDSPRMRGYLRYLLKQNYPGSSWTERP